MAQAQAEELAEEAVDTTVQLFGNLDEIAIAIGDYRISLLEVLTVVVTVILIYVITRAVLWGVKRLIKRTSRFDPAQGLLAEKLATIVTIALAFLVGVDLLGFDLSALAVFSGAVGLAVGFGLQKTFGNLIAGIILLMDRSVKPGDVIVVGDTFGAISKIGTRAVSVITRDGKEHLIPNELLMTEPVENWSYSSRNVRVQIPVGVSYACDIDRVEQILIECTTACERVLEAPKPNVWLKEFGDNSVNFEIQAWIRDPEAGVGNVRSAVLKKVWWRFKEEGIEIPFPQRDVYLKTVPAALGAEASR
ncbi:mechanosensitive ion channel family protein [Sphingomicrobium astaxanthinifaciens]|uniref:mechanosensitive ion channel family protein n=1 Tax=Sphingomicrobium astaxanthinifaciens TaxID=1227949 RepID=UPI001FCB4ABA|nr:mechanosensitive ion channel domain-containing protein [Sphingomicrobium astaxanthinifaciens]MCJ7420741.1 mechanosensitive ion channel [Sphingomicrobium astaxanthinifaciens]